MREAGRQPGGHDHHDGWPAAGLHNDHDDHRYAGLHHPAPECVYLQRGMRLDLVRVYPYVVAK